ncbi:MAG: hypothetical protein AAGL49_13875, partial [Pseudomonadota bacterium]
LHRGDVRQVAQGADPQRPQRHVPPGAKAQGRGPVLIRRGEGQLRAAAQEAQFVAVGGALMAVFLADRLGRWGPLVIGVLGGACFIALLLGEPSYLVFAIAVSGFNFLWNMVLPFILSAVGDMDADGHAMTPAIAMQMIGLGFGPFFAARILGEGGGFAAIEWMTISLLALSLVLLAGPIALQRAALARRSEPVVPDPNT